MPRMLDDNTHYVQASRQIARRRLALAALRLTDELKVAW
jgi:hypothetical protein